MRSTWTVTSGPQVVLSTHHRQIVLAWCRLHALKIPDLPQQPPHDWAVDLTPIQ